MKENFIYKLMQERQNYGLGRSPKNDEILNNLLRKNLDSFAYVSAGMTIVNGAMKMGELASSYYIKSIFSLADADVNRRTIFNLFIFDKKKPETIKIGEYTGKLVGKKLRIPQIRLVNVIAFDELPKTYKKYLNLIEEYLITDIKPEDTENYWFNEIQYEEFNPHRLEASFYSKESIEKRKIVLDKAYVFVSDVAEIVGPNKLEEVKMVTDNDLKYPLDLNNLKTYRSTHLTKIQKGDIVIFNNPFNGIKVYLMDREYDEPLAVRATDIVLRPYDILPEYLFLYLDSDLLQDVLFYISRGYHTKTLLRKDVCKLPIAKPSKDKQVYIKAFELLYYKNHPLGQFREEAKSILAGKPATPFEELLTINISDTLKKFVDQKAYEIIKTDMEELLICYKNKAYKASLIMAGSILEAFIIDWLSEIKGVDYFKEDYKVTKRNRQVYATLIDYINEIDDINKPHWMEEANQAHEIRKKRNLVHAKLCLKEDLGINEKTCEMVIEYLNNIIDSRFKNYIENK